MLSQGKLELVTAASTDAAAAAALAEQLQQLQQLQKESEDALAAKDVELQQMQVHAGAL